MDHAEVGRTAFTRGAWGEAFEHLRRAEELEQDDQERLAIAAQLVGDSTTSDLGWERAHRLAVTNGDPDRAARCAFWLGLDLLLRGEGSRANGWLARAERFATEEPTGAAAAWLLLPQFLGARDAGDCDTALELATQMTTRGRDTEDDDLVAFGLLCRGEALVASGETISGATCFDEAMVLITTGQVSPVATGIIYCAVIDSCMHACDVPRAAEWTDALSTWCSSDPALVPFRGQCLVHRSQVLTARGSWQQASDEADRARARLAERAHPALGLAIYQQAELLRLRGQLAEAEGAYRAANRHGYDPEPGFALLRLAQGRPDAATTAARRMLAGDRFHPNRSRIVAAAVEILVATAELDGAMAAADELDDRAAGGSIVMLSAMASTARASLHVARGDFAAAAGLLPDVIATWRALDMPFEEAKARVLMATACRGLGDADAAELQRDAAASIFEQLGARTELARLGRREDATPLTTRECEVVRLVATGCTNREIAAQLSISEHTVGRHLQNVFMKLGLSSRAAATAYAYEHGLV